MADTSASPPNVYTLTAANTADQFGTDMSTGLRAEEAERRLQQYGPNHLVEKKRESGWRAFLRQYRDPMQIVLVSVALITIIFTGEWLTALVLVGLSLTNAIQDLRQEAKAEASLASLAATMKQVIHVRRCGSGLEIDVEELVIGDIVLLQAGDVVPADGRLFEAATLQIDESSLTGESTPVLKQTEAIDNPDLALGDRTNMAFMQTAVTRGSGQMIVTATGMSTQIGHIADRLNKTETDVTPLQKQLGRLTLTMVELAGATFVVMIVLGLSRGQDFRSIFIAGVALAISAIPTGMPTVITALYSLGARALARQNAIVKRLPSVETLGSVSAICTDKTGTLTLNKMTAREFTVPGQNRYAVTGQGYSTEGRLLHSGGAKIDLDEVLLPMALCSDAELDGEDLIGDPTEGALIVLAEKGGIHVTGAREMYPRIAEVPFDAEYKFMATFHNMENEKHEPVVRCFVKGAPDVLIARGGSYWEPAGQVQPITEENRPVALEENDRMAQSGQRVMVVARRDLDPATFDPKGILIELVDDLTLLAMVGIVDPPRAEAKDAIATCHSAGIQVRMITGDHTTTAAAIGQELGIEGNALTGVQFAAMSDEEVRQQLPDIAVVARVAPEDKIRLVTMLQQENNIVAMTGDGINDAPALKKADIGVAMGITGTDVSKEAAVMILTDDNFATVVKAVEYGRAIYNNLFNYIRFQMTALMGFISSYLLAAMFMVTDGVPFTVLGILWVSFFVQASAGLSLGFGPPAPNLMQNKPRSPLQPILSRAQWARIGFTGFLMAAATVYLESVYEASGVMVALSVGFVAFSLFSVVIGLSAHSETASIFSRDVNILGNRYQLALYGFALVMTILPTEVEFLRRLLGLTGLDSVQWVVCIAFAILLLLGDETIKFFLRRSQSRDDS